MRIERTKRPPERAQQLSLGSETILGRRQQQRLEESTRMTRENTLKRMARNEKEMIEERVEGDLERS